jgi:acetolactate synthase-1/2/3 large subunit
VCRLPESLVSVENAAQAYLELLRAKGVRYFFVNPGTDSAPINDAFSRFVAEGKDSPRLILVPHETPATAMAYGYAMVTGEPQVVMVHVNVGTANALSMVMNAQRGRVPIVVTAGRTPVTEEGLPGTREGGNHWGQESYDQGSILREYVKWDYEFRSAIQLPSVVDRAFKIARAEPQGPVYLILPREWLVEPMMLTKIPDASWSTVPSPPAPSLEVLKEAAKILVGSENPLILTSRVGGKPSAVRRLVELAETLALPVVEVWRTRMNFPTTHPLHLGYDAENRLRTSDVILLIDCDVPWVPKRVKPSELARIIQIDVDPIQLNYPLWGYPVTLPITADASTALPALTSIIKDTVEDDPSTAPRVEERRARIEEEHRRQREEWRRQAEAAKGLKPIDFTWLSHEINAALGKDMIIVNEFDLVASQVDLTEPSTYFSGSTASALGFALGAALGAKLASPGKTVIACVGDGSYIFGCPVAAHWVSRAYGLPVLFIVFNNRGYRAVKNSIWRLLPEGWSVKTGRFIGADLDPSPDYVSVIKSSGGYGETVEDPEGILPALARALEVVRMGRQALLDVICAKS